MIGDLFGDNLLCREVITNEFWVHYGFFLWLLTTLLLLGVIGWLVWLQVAKNGQGVDLGQAEHTAEQVSQLLISSMQMKASLVQSFQSCGLSRYSAYNEVGAGPSFSIALADGQGNGVVLSFINGRQTTRVYAKPLILWGSDQSLSEHELEVIEQAKAKRR